MVCFVSTDLHQGSHRLIHVGIFFAVYPIHIPDNHRHMLMGLFCVTSLYQDSHRHMMNGIFQQAEINEDTAMFYFV